LRGILDEGESYFTYIQGKEKMKSCEMEREELIEKYEYELKNGNNPDPREYIQQYRGNDVQEFEEDMVLAMMLIKCAQQGSDIS